MRKRNHRMNRETLTLRRVGAVRGIVPDDLARLHRPHTPEAVAELMNATQTALIRMLEGNGEMRDLTRIGRDVNIAWVRTEQIGNNAAAQSILEAAASAIEDGARLLKKHGRVGLTGPGRLALMQAVDLFREILSASTPKEMAQAEDIVVATERRIRQQAQAAAP